MLCQQRLNECSRFRYMQLVVCYVKFANSAESRMCSVSVIEPLKGLLDKFWMEVTSERASVNFEYAFEMWLPACSPSTWSPMVAASHAPLLSRPWRS